MALNFVLPSATAAPATAVTASPATFARPAATATTSTSSQTATLGAVAAVAGLAMRKRNRSKISRNFSLQMPALPAMPFMVPPKKTVVITGASSGLGLAAAKALAEQGWQVVMACRDFQKAEKAAKEAGMDPENYQVMHCDLASKQSVRNFVQTFRTQYQSLDALVCNAAVYFPNAHKEGVFLPGLFPGGGPRWSAEGHEMSFAANYLGHFLLCNLLLEDLKKSAPRGTARCVILGTVTATVNGSELGGMIPPLAHVGNFEGLEQGMKAPVTMLDGGAFDGAKAYKDSKVCDVMLMKELHRRFHKETGIVFTSLYPGCIAETGLFREHYPVFQNLFPAFHKTVTKAYVSQEEAGKRLAAVVADDRYGTSGSYYSWEGEAGTGGGGGQDAVSNTDKDFDWFMNYGSFRTLSIDEIGGEAGDDQRCSKLWELSEKLVA